ncbi:MAG TPA: hypothetical protein VGG86_20870 [Roseiarcus sp.]|jgi:hypothetical protein
MSEATELLKADLADFCRAKEERALAKRRARRNPNAIPRLPHEERCAILYLLYCRVPRKAVAKAFNVSTPTLAIAGSCLRFPKLARTPGGRPITVIERYETVSERGDKTLPYRVRRTVNEPLAPPAIEPERCYRKGAYQDIAREMLAMGPEAFGEKYFDRHMRDRVLQALQKNPNSP